MDQSDKKIYIAHVSPEPGTDEVFTISAIAMPEWNEVGQYSESEVKLYWQAVRDTPKPVWIKVEYDLNTYRTNHEEAMQQWEDWKKLVNENYQKLKDGTTE